MRLVIDIPDMPLQDYQDLLYKIHGMAAGEGLFDDRIKSQRALALKVVLDILVGVVSGEVLPKGHGRLIDADELKKEYPHDADWDYPVNTNSYVVESIDNADTIIEADKAESEDKDDRDGDRR